MSAGFKKTNLFRLLEEDDEQNEPTENTENFFISSQQSSYKINKFNDESTCLDNSTVPTYEEFTTKTNSQKSKQFNAFNKQLLNSTEASYALVTDDDSSNDENDDLSKKFDNLSLLNKKKETKPMSTPVASKNYLTNNNLLVNKSPYVTPKVNDNDKFKLRLLQDKSLQKSVHFTPKAIVSSPVTQNTPRSTKKSNELGNSFEYVAHNNQNLQTSFASTQNDENSAAIDSIIEIVDSSVDSKNESKDFIQNASVVEEVVEAQSVGVSAMGASMLEPIMMKPKNPVAKGSSSAADFFLHLSSSSESNSPIFEDSPPKNNVTMRKRESKRDSKRLSVTTGRFVSVKATNKKRVSMCGEELSEVILNIDETIMDEYENEQDQKKGRLFVLEESSAEKETNSSSSSDVNVGSGPSIIKETDPDDDSSENSNKYENESVNQSLPNIGLEPKKTVDSILTSDKTSSDENKAKQLNKSKPKEESSSSESQNEKPFVIHKPNKTAQKTTKKRASDDSSSSEDKLENFFTQYRPKVVEPVKNKKNDIKDFLVDSTEDIEEVEEDEEEEDFEESPKPKKGSKKNAKSTTKKPAKKILKSSSSSSFEPSSKSDDDSEAEAKKYDKDLQLFYIKTTNKLNNDNKGPKQISNTNTKKKSKAKASRSSLLDDSTSVISLVSSSSFSSSTDELPGLSSSSSDDDSDSFGKKFRTKFPVNDFTGSQFKTPRNIKNKAESDSRLVKTQAPVSKKPPKKLTFIESLSINLANEELRDPEVLPYLKKFKNKNSKNELLKKCYDLLNEASFDNKLPHDMKLVWSGRLSSTGGYCKNSTRAGVRSSEIHISTKVCDSAERMRDTLAHEMCHAAAFLINGLLDGHGPVWKSWANRVNFTFKEIPKITVTHSYAITKKFIYRCTVCRFEIHRFSKSINIEKELCGLCHGRFELHLNNPNQKDSHKNREEEDDRFDKIKDDVYTIESPKIPSNQVSATPRQPNKFALYVKDNYGSVKKEKNLSNHKDVMQELSKNFKTLSTK